MTGTRFCAIVALAALLAGCLGPRREQILNDLVGQDLSVAIETLGQPREVVELGEGRRTYVWERVFIHDDQPAAFSNEYWRHESRHWFDDDPEEVPARLCSTGLQVGFDLVVESWDYGCETVTVDRERGRIRRGRGPWVDYPR
jgi:hypothetical protein